MKRAAAVDIGTNSTRLLIADVDPGAGVLADVERRAQVTALGRGVDRTGRLTPGAVERTTRVLESYGRLIRAAGAEASRAAATSAARDAANGAEFLDAASAALGFRPEIIDGGEEAALVFMGAAGRSADSVHTTAGSATLGAKGSGRLRTCCQGTSAGCPPPSNAPSGAAPPSPSTCSDSAITGTRRPRPKPTANPTNRLWPTTGIR